MFIHSKTFFKRWLINLCDCHGRRHEVSRKVSLARLLLMGIGS